MLTLTHRYDSSSCIVCVLLYIRVCLVDCDCEGKLLWDVGVGKAESHLAKTAMNKLLGAMRCVKSLY